MRQRRQKRTTKASAHSPQPRLERRRYKRVEFKLSPRMRLALSLGFFAFGIVTFDFDAPKWGLLGAALYATPLAFQILRLPQLWNFASVMSFVILFQSVAAAIFLDDFITLPPNLSYQLQMESPEFPGIHGPQHILTDAKGFRSAKKIAYESPSALRIFAIGGSTTADIYLGNDQMWTQLTQTKLEEAFDQEIEMVNTGAPGLSSPNHLATLRHIEPWHPNAVLIMMGANDWMRHLEREAKSVPEFAFRTRPFSFRRSVLGRGLELLKISLTGNPRTEMTENRTVTGWDYGSPRNSLARMDVRSFQPSEVSPEFEFYLERIARRCHSKKMGCVFVSQVSAYFAHTTNELKKLFWMTPPNEPYTLDQESLTSTARLYNEFVKATAEKYGLPYCDIAGALDASTSTFYDDMHFNQSGAAAFSERLAQCLVKVLPHPSR